jgi:hypothetical protein
MNQKILLKHGETIPDENIISQGEVLVQHANTVTDSTLHTISGSGELVSFPSKQWVSNEINTTFNKIDLDGFNNIVKELQNNKQYIITALNEKGIAASIDDTFMELANKITQIKEKEIITLPAETSNDFANTFFNTMMKSQGYDEMYETVWANYCGENGYVGALMTSLNKGTNTSIVLTGADAYYIYEEDKFYTVDENKKLVTVINGISTNLGTQSHLWDVENLNSIRTVFYLYVEGSTASGDRENIHESYFDYCKDSNIPNIQYKSKSGKFMHFHVSNPDTCQLMWNGTTNANTRCIYFYTNVEIINGDIFLYSNANNLCYVDFNNLKTINNGGILYISNTKVLPLQNLETIKGKIILNSMGAASFIYSCDNIKTLNCPKLTKVEIEQNCIFIRSCKNITNNYTPNLQYINNGILIQDCGDELTLDFPSLIGCEESNITQNAILVRSLSTTPTKINSLNIPSIKYVNNGKRTLTLLHNCIINEIDLSSLEQNNIGDGGYFILSNVNVTKIILPNNIEINRLLGGQGGESNFTNRPENLTVITESFFDTKNEYPTFAAKKVYLPNLKKCRYWLGAGASYNNSYCNYIYLGCYGDRDDEILIGLSSGTHQYERDIEIREGARQKITLYTNKNYQLNMTTENIINHIFKKLADNNFEDDGVTPSEPIKITIGSDNLNKLTDEEKAIATDKNYILA